MLTKTKEEHLTQEIVEAVHSLPDDIQERLANETDPRALVSHLIMSHYDKVDKGISLPHGGPNPGRYAARIGKTRERH